MKILKNEIKKLGLEIKALRKELKEKNRENGYANYHALTIAKEEFRLKYLGYCYLKRNNGKENSGTINEEFFKIHEKGGTKPIDMTTLYIYIGGYAEEIDNRKYAIRNELKKLTAESRELKNQRDSSLRKTGRAETSIYLKLKENASKTTALLHGYKKGELP